MQGYVYLIGSPTFRWYKIGKSVTPHVRVHNLGILLPFKIAVIGVWRASDYSAMELALHQIHIANRINGEWFRFSKKEVVAIIDSIPEKARIFPSPDGTHSAFASFSNIERDCAENETVRFKIKKMRGDFTPEERETRRQLAIKLKKESKNIASFDGRDYSSERREID